MVVYNAERQAPGSNIHTLGDSLWWAATTVTTVGYGDRYPVTGTGRVMAVMLMLTGIALVGVVTAAVASYFVNLVRQATTAQADEDASDKHELLLAEIQALRASVDALHARLDVKALE